MEDIERLNLPVSMTLFTRNPGQWKRFADNMILVLIQFVKNGFGFGLTGQAAKTVYDRVVRTGVAQGTDRVQYDGTELKMRADIVETESWPEVLDMEDILEEQR